jgi:hypothetical protein
MSIEALKEFFMWCSIVNVGIMMFSFIMLVLMKNFVYKMHSKWFPISFEHFCIIMYSFFGIYKIFIFVFNVVPYIVFEIMS